MVADLIKAVAEIVRYVPHVAHASTAASGVLNFAPPGLLGFLRVDGFKPAHNDIVGVWFLCSFFLSICLVTALVWANAKKVLDLWRLRRRVVNRLKDLTYSEAQRLHGYVNDHSRVCGIPSGDPEICTLEDDGIVEKDNNATTLARHSIYRLSDIAWQILNNEPELIDLEIVKARIEAQQTRKAERIKNKRPKG